VSQPDPNASDKPDISPRLVVAVVVAVLLVIFILQNTQRVSIRFLIFSFSSPLWLILVLVAVLAALLDDVLLRAVRKKKPPQ
jgi:uncharacterized integral membrane protein